MLLPAVAALAVLQSKAYRLAPAFSVTLPSAPRQRATPASGEDLGTYSWSLAGKSVAYSFSSTGLSEEELSNPVDQILANYVHAKADDSRSRLLEERDLLMQGWPAIESKMRTQKGELVWVRYCLRDRRGYTLVATTKAATFPVETKSIFDSAKFSGSPGILKRTGPTFAAYRFPDTEVSVDLPGSPEIQNRSEDADEGLAQVAEGVYGSRRYSFGYRDAGADDAIDEVPEFVERATEGEERPKGKETSRRSYDLGEQKVTSVEFASEDGKVYGRTDAVKVGDRVYFFVATVPMALKKSTELDRFFASIKLPS